MYCTFLITVFLVYFSFANLMIPLCIMQREQRVRVSLMCSDAQWRSAFNRVGL